MNELEDLKFTKTHEWIAADGKAGISDHAQREVTDVVFVEIPSVGKTFTMGQELATIESVKAAFPIYAPVSGVLKAVNEKVIKDPSWVNRSPYGEGWLFQLEISNGSEIDSLMNHEQYQEFLKTESVHH